MELVAQKKAEIEAEAQAGEKKAGLHGGPRDLLSLLLKANMATDIPDNQRLTDEDVLARACLGFTS